MNNSFSVLLLAIIISFLIPKSTIAQKDVILYKFVGSITNEDKPIAEAEIRVFKENDWVLTAYSDKKGKFEVIFERNTSHTLEINMDGFYTKRMLFITDVESGVKKLPPLKFDVNLVSNNVYDEIEKKSPESVSILDFPSTIIEYDSEIQDFNYRKQYTENISKEVEKIRD